MRKLTMGFIGGGRITRIFLKAFQNKGIELGGISVFDPNLNGLELLKTRHPEITVDHASIENAASSEVVFLAVHPPIVSETLATMKQYLKKESVVVSLAPKITIEKIRAGLEGVENIARVNPSAPGIMNQGMNPVAFAKIMDLEKKNTLIEILSILGDVTEVEESKIEAYAVICAMGSTYFWFQLQMLQEMAVSFGMDENEAKDTLTKMMAGTMNTLFYSGIQKEEVMDLVPVKPLGEFEETIKSYYSDKLNMIFEKIKP